MKFKLNKYAEQLDSAFKAARASYKKAESNLSDAEERRRKAEYFEEKFIGEKAAKIACADAALKQAKAEFDAVSCECWQNFQREKKRLTAELQDAVHADSLVDPDKVDAVTLELLKSGVCRADDYMKLLDRFDGNSTMTRLIGKYAADAAANAADSVSRSQYEYIATSVNGADEAIMQSWQNICDIADTLTGQLHGRGERTYTLHMNAQWEELAAPVIEAL